MLLASTAQSPFGSQPTYEELKPQDFAKLQKGGVRSQPTYEELKHKPVALRPALILGSQPTYEELKQWRRGRGDPANKRFPAYL